MSGSPWSPRAASGSVTDYDPSISVSVIVVNWNGRSLLEDCLRSLTEQSLADVEIIVVDNGSSDGSVEWIGAEYKERVRVIRHAENLGYAAGLNAGIEAARGRYIFVLNNDTVLDRDCLAALVRAADDHPAAGSFAPKIFSFFDRTLIDNVGHLIYADGLSRGRGRFERDCGQYDRSEEILLGSGCAMLLRRAMLADVGLFDEDLFAYCDDTDLGLRAKLRGWSCWFVPQAIVYHKYSGSSGEYSELKAFLVERNRAWVATKCLPFPLMIVCPLFTAMRLALQAYGAVRRQGAAGRFVSNHSFAELAAVFVRAMLAAVRGLPSAWRKRRCVQAGRRVGLLESVAWFVRYRMSLREIALKD